MYFGFNVYLEEWIGFVSDFYVAPMAPGVVFFNNEHFIFVELD